MNDELREAIAEALERPFGEGNHHWAVEAADAVLALPEVAALRAKADAADRVREALADLTEAVGRGDEYGLPEAYRAARRALDGDQS